MPRSTTDRLFPQAFADLKQASGLTLRALAERMRAADPAGKGLSYSHLSRLASGEEPLRPEALRLIAGAFDELPGPEYFVEFRMALLRQAFDPAEGDPHDALARFLAWEALPKRQRDRVLNSAGHAAGAAASRPR